MFRRARLGPPVPSLGVPHCFGIRKMVKKATTRWRLSASVRAAHKDATAQVIAAQHGDVAAHFSYGPLRAAEETSGHEHGPAADTAGEAGAEIPGIVPVEHQGPPVVRAIEAGHLRRTGALAEI